MSDAVMAPYVTPISLLGGFVQHAEILLPHATILTLPNVEPVLVTNPPVNYRMELLAARLFPRFSVPYANPNSPDGWCSLGVIHSGTTPVAADGSDCSTRIYDNTFAPFTTVDLTNFLADVAGLNSYVLAPSGGLAVVIDPTTTVMTAAVQDAWASQRGFSLSISSQLSKNLTGGDPANLLGIQLVYAVFPSTL